jgi:PKHD-type hydroxylase
MSNYIFSPSPTYGTDDHPYVFWESGFSEEDVSKIIALGDSLAIQPAVTGDMKPGEDISAVRRSRVSWMGLNSDTTWLYDKVAHIMRRLNAQYYQYDLYGFVEHFQYTIYESNELGHYEWHIDSTVSAPSPRKLSFVLQLSDPSEYEGGDLQLMYSKDLTTIKKEKGFVVAFPSHMLHRVTPVTSGTRRTLVVWAAGPAFR